MHFSLLPIARDAPTEVEMRLSRASTPREQASTFPHIWMARLEVLGWASLLTQAFMRMLQGPLNLLIFPSHSMPFRERSRQRQFLAFLTILRGATPSSPSLPKMA